MGKVILHSQYNHFPGHSTNDQEEATMELWNDGKIWEYIQHGYSKGSALLIEPRCLQNMTYELVEKEYQRFDNIFTHDTQLLTTLPNAHQILYWNEYEIHNEPKTKDISMICGNKSMCNIHNLRQIIAERIHDDVDILGTWNGGRFCTKQEAYAPYRFAIVIENYIDDYWFTEKLLNAFSNRTIPIYFGARKIHKYFNIDGIIQLNNLWDVFEVVNDIKYQNPKAVYYKMHGPMEDNFQRVQKYINFEDWFFKTYGGDI